MNKSRTTLAFAALVALTLLSIWLGAAVGTTSFSPTALWDNDPLVLHVRLPRLALALLTGAALSASGVAFQALLRNPLAEPYVVGVSGGAALGAVLALALGLSAWWLPLWSFSGALLSIGLVFGACYRATHHDATTLLLLGVVFNSFAAAVVTLVKLLVSPTKAQEILFWLVGQVGVESWSTLFTLAAYVSVALCVLYFSSGVLNILALGDTHAEALGLAVGRTRMIVFIAAALLVGAVVSVAGMIGFVGLVVPHVARRLVGHDHRVLLPFATLGGACFLALADIVARLCFALTGTEIPVGAVTAFLGGPFFLAVLLQRHRQRLA